MVDPRVIEGVRLIVARSWYDAHEALEGPWQEREAGPDRDALQSVIQITVALEHLQRGNALGCFNVWNRARVKLKQLGPDHAWVDGIGVGDWNEALGPFFEEARLADRVKAGLEGGVTDGAEHLDVSTFPPLPVAERWPLPPLSDDLQQLL